MSAFEEPLVDGKAFVQLQQPADLQLQHFPLLPSCRMRVFHGRAHRRTLRAGSYAKCKMPSYSLARLKLAAVGNRPLSHRQGHQLCLS
jgi:hypothetical protein